MAKLTFSAPIQILNSAVLPAGTYWFVLANAPTNQNVVRIFRPNWSLITMAMTLPIERQRGQLDDQMTVKLASTPGHPAVLLQWFYPGAIRGHQFANHPSEGTVLSEQAPVAVQLVH